MSNGDFVHLPLVHWTYAELVQYNQSDILLAIPRGEFNSAVAAATNRTLMWKEVRK